MEDSNQALVRGCEHQIRALGRTGGHMRSVQDEEEFGGKSGREKNLL